ncbi:CidA/LrgA family protein [Agarivorans sp. MS3-6]|uniref:CidA/LrgA family protein n=1 Tax=Agarivorans sp. TSD2052 TaxID=2937286 RepID=UPI00200F66C7|nr:CidA/LrgA family protein [Agarivorans sp. TSD2052]UPW19945.1 CidA/LrgA family protein [Agarivorans sp. TSD2052]
MRKFQKSVLLEICSGLLVIYAALWLGRWLSEISGQLLPASIMGMLALTIALQFRWIRLSWVERTANQFVRWMSLLFVPISIGLVDHIETLLQALPAMLLTCAVATLVLLVVVGKLYQHWEHTSEQKGALKGEAKP